MPDNRPRSSFPSYGYLGAVILVVGIYAFVKHLIETPSTYDLRWGMAVVLVGIVLIALAYLKDNNRG